MIIIAPCVPPVMHGEREMKTKIVMLCILLLVQILVS